MATKKKTTKSKKKLDVKVRMIGELIDATGSSKDSWNPAEISDDMKAISYIRKLADTWNPAQLNEALKYLGFATIDSWNPAIIEETKNKLVKYFLPTDASGNPIELDLKGALPYEVTALTITLLPIQSGTGDPDPDNERPITGRDSVTLTVNGDDIETTFENTVYGGTLDLISGKLTIDKAYKKFTSSDVWGISGAGSAVKTIEYMKTLYSREKAGICSKLKTDNGVNGCAQFGSNQGSNSFYIVGAKDYYGLDTVEKIQEFTDGMEICYPLATPIEVTLTAEQISLLKGINVLTTDGDNINITYKAILNS